MYLVGMLASLCSYFIFIFLNLSRKNNSYDFVLLVHHEIFNLFYLVEYYECIIYISPSLYFPFFLPCRLATILSGAHVSGFSFQPYCNCFINIVAYRSIAKQWLCKQWPFLGNSWVNTFPLLGSRFLIMQQLDYNNGNEVFSMWSVLRCYKHGTKWRLFSFTCWGPIFTASHMELNWTLKWVWVSFESSVKFRTGGCEDRASACEAE
jgi:hypothetical protein